MSDEDENLIDGEMTYKDMVTFLTSLGNRIDSYWHRYLYMNAAFGVLFASQSLSLPPLAVVLLLIMFVFILWRTTEAMRNTYKGIETALSDIKGKGHRLPNFPQVHDWISGHSFANRDLEVRLLFWASAGGMSVLAIEFQKVLNLLSVQSTQ